MIISPEVANNKGYILPPCNKERLAPNGINVRIKEVFLLKSNSYSLETSPVLAKEGLFFFGAGNTYIINMFETIILPDKVCALLLPKSILPRSGLIFTSGLYETGFIGNIGGTMYAGTNITLKVLEPVAQVIFMEAEFYKVYAGDYQFQKDQHGSTYDKTILNHE